MKTHDENENVESALSTIESGSQSLEPIVETVRSPQQYVVLYGGAAFETVGSACASGAPTPAEELRPKNSVTCLAPVGAAGGALGASSSPSSSTFSLSFCAAVGRIAQTDARYAR